MPMLFRPFYKRLGFFILILLANSACAQTLKLVEQRNAHHKIYELEVKPGKTQNLQLRDSFTSTVIELRSGNGFDGLYLINNEDTIQLEKAQHNPKGEFGLKSSLIILEERTDQIKIFTKTKSQKLLLHLLDSKAKGSIKKRAPRSNGTNIQCSRPATVPQSDWREGLPEPDYTPIEHKINHAIIHHSAGNTQNSDTREVVRNIYLNHTQVNGWSDIGYNFLIGINGQIFEGRDGLGQVTDYRVKGAHFCGKNSNTVGIGLIGNYEDHQPSEASLDSLKRLLAWQLHENNLNPHSYHDHPSNIQDPDTLGTIAGHKDGCATLCPGKNLYGRIPSIKNEITDSLSKCGNSTRFAQSKPIRQVSLQYHQGDILIKGNFSNGTGQLGLYDLQGKALSPNQAFHFSEDQISKVQIPNHIQPGIYVAKLQTSEGTLHTKKLMIP